jgi:hypothetical protein
MAKKFTPKVNVDLDALMGEVYQESRAVKVGGVVYTIPAEIPARLVLQYNRLTRAILDATAEAQQLDLEFAALQAHQEMTEAEKAVIREQLEARAAQLDVPSDEETMRVYQELIDFACGAGTYEAVANTLSVERIALLASVIINKQMDGLQGPLAPTATGPTS